MNLKKLYLVEEWKFYYKDPIDGEDVEDIRLIGYFTTMDKVLNAIKVCINHGVKKEEIRITEIEFEAKNQKYVYILYYEYSIEGEEGFTDYYYNFEPLTNKKKCLQLKEKLLKDDFYKPTENKIFDDYTDRGFSIRKELIDDIVFGDIYLKESVKERLRREGIWPPLDPELGNK